MADFAVYFHRYLHSCISECSIVPRLQGILYQLMFVPSFLTLDLPLTLALCRYILEMHKAYTTKNSLDIDTINTLLAAFGTPTFRISLMNFFLGKAFNNDRNILCNHIPLEREGMENHRVPTLHTYIHTYILYLSRRSINGS